MLYCEVFCSENLQILSFFSISSSMHPQSINLPKTQKLYLHPKQPWTAGGLGIWATQSLGELYSHSFAGLDLRKFCFCFSCQKVGKLADMNDQNRWADRIGNFNKKSGRDPLVHRPPLPVQRSAQKASRAPKLLISTSPKSMQKLSMLPQRRGTFYRVPN